MKLYNLFESVILEEIKIAKRLITEGVSDEDIDAAINGMYNVNIEYLDDKNTPPSKRYIQVYNRGKTKANNPAIRVFQIFGGSKTTPNEGAWKILRIDRIVSWHPTKMKWYNPVSDKGGVPAYNQLGDKSMSSVAKLVDPLKFNKQRSDINQKPNEKNI